MKTLRQASFLTWDTSNTVMLNSEKAKRYVLVLLRWKNVTLIRFIPTGKVALHYICLANSTYIGGCPNKSVCEEWANAPHSQWRHMLLSSPHNHIISLKSGSRDFAELRTDNITKKYAKFSVHLKLGNQNNLAAINCFHIYYTLHINMYKVTCSPIQ